MADHDDAKLHIAMLPWLAFGHLIPFLELSKLLASKGHKISFISTPQNIDRLPQIPLTLITFINFIKIDLPKVDNLPESAESTKDLPFNKVKYLKIAYDLIQGPIATFLKTSSLDWIMYDFNTNWLGPTAAQHGVRSPYFIVFPTVIRVSGGPPVLAMHGGDTRVTPEDYIKRPKWVSLESQVWPSLFQLTGYFEWLDAVDGNVSDSYRAGATIHGCDAVIVRSSWDFEPEWLILLKEIYRKPVIPTGLLPAAAADGDASWPETEQWLDKHEKGSVVYIAFGTETKPSQYELTQLSLGVELSGLLFYWVLIDRRGSSDDDVIELPHGFEERTCGRGVVCRGWEPKFKILSHDSVGGLLIHSGMGSMAEGFQLDKPLVLLPCMMDQGLMASYFVEKKMACMVHKEDVDRSLTPESVADSLSLVMVREDGKIYKEKAKEIMALFGDKDVEDKYVDELISFLQN